MSTPIARSGSNCGEPETKLLPIAEAKRRIEGAVVPLADAEDVAVLDALGRVLAEDIVSPIDVPGHTNSALDGYAINGADIPESGHTALTVIGTAWAGRPFKETVHTGQAVRIMTGAPIPRGCDTVVGQELVEVDGDTVRIDASHRPGQNVRSAGEDLAKDKVALQAGARLLPAELGLIASLGVNRVKVVRRLRVAFFSTGDELRAPGEPLDDGGVYDSNRFILFGMLTRLGAEVMDKGIIRDEREAVRDAVLSAAETADVIITTGGVSTGEADYVEEVLAAHGQVGFWRVSIKPGRPLAFGHIGDALFFGLPGNPVAVMVTFYQFLQPTLMRMMGDKNAHAVPLMKAICTSKLSKKIGRTEFYRATLARDEQGELVVRRNARQGSGILHSMSEANCFIILPDDCGAVEPGTEVDVQPFFGLV